VIPFLSPIKFTSAWNFNAGSIPNFWFSLSGFTFDLALSHIVNQSPNFLNVAGIGTLSAAGFDPTPAVFDFTIPSSNSDTIVGYVASVSTNFPVVPDTTTTGVLAGLCLAGLMAIKISLRSRQWVV
jgi:hypothetical protein